MILVTGGTGFIGEALLRSLKVTGDKFRIISRTDVIGVETIKCDFLNDEIPNDCFKDVSTIFHLAGFAHDFSDASKIEHIYKQINVNTSVRLAELAVKNNVKKFIYVSSVKAGGSSIKNNCYSEEDQGIPEGICGKTKREAELKILKIGKESNMRVIIIRPSLVYGPNLKGNLYKMYSGIKKGWFPPIPETGNIRSMIHVDDLVRAILFLSNNKLIDGEIFIATDGKNYSTSEIYKIFSIILGKNIPKWHVPIFLFTFAGMVNSKMNYKIQKLLGDECYSSEKLNLLGFQAKLSLKDLNETIF